jgi:hypothetical protein
MTGGVANTMSGGREILTPTSTPAIVGTGTIHTNTDNNVRESNFFIQLNLDMLRDAYQLYG